MGNKKQVTSYKSFIKFTCNCLKKNPTTQKQKKTPNLQKKENFPLAVKRKKPEFEGKTKQTNSERDEI